MLDLYREWAKLKGYDAITATDGQKCLSIYRKGLEKIKEKNQKCFDIVVLDHVMPNMTGVETAVEILKLNPNQRIIFASGYVKKIMLESITKINKVIEVIEKPFSLKRLEEIVDKNTMQNKFEEINSNQKIKTPIEKYNKAIEIINQLQQNEN